MSVMPAVASSFFRNFLRVELFNANTVDDLAEAERLAALDGE